MIKILIKQKNKAQYARRKPEFKDWRWESYCKEKRIDPHGKFKIKNKSISALELEGLGLLFALAFELCD